MDMSDPNTLNAQCKVVSAMAGNKQWRVRGRNEKEQNKKTIIWRGSISLRLEILPSKHNMLEIHSSIIIEFPKT